MNAQNLPGKKGRALTCLLCLAALAPGPLKGDLLEMTNGDRYAGKVISVTQSNVSFQSGIQGRLNLPRSTVARISFGEAAARMSAVAPSAAPPNLKTNEPIKPPPKLDFDSKSLSQVQQDLLSTASPEARRQFNETVKGLMTGKLSIDDIRAQARNSVKEIKAAREELGEDAGGLLAGYLHILEHFLQETDPAPVVAPAEKPKATNSPAALAPQK
jgi:hypothetical protein